MRAWREAATTSLRDRTDGTYAVHMYFDRLGHDEPERAVAFLEALLANEPDDALVALTAQGKLLGQLLHFNGRRVAHSLQQLALRQKRLRWLHGGEWGRKAPPARHRRQRGLRGLEETYQGRETPDFAVLPIAELAALWVEIMSLSDLDKEKDEHWSELFDFQSELVNNDPLKALELVKAILEIEENPNVLGLLAAGMLEDLIPAQDGPVVDAVGAARNPRFRHLLGGVWFYSMSPEVAEKLEKARGGERW